ncbi:hypothetical protein NLX83_14365 [Allokutzneria sp. A3M-2-11 16]|uniref:CocE/NonD family hydrolase n=1 Tax=Allokutzneria sp. A3M-2-11 16 TaxID=2962043 RepID=UPI0020B766F3|nr:CocE/NonD family hydrolase [Allokutzneria sp. A3M-2-11 16]MCP3800446.1 hypothetical protein [Allokutzneria sp. A3M-2-11 16]
MLTRISVLVGLLALITSTVVPPASARPLSGGLSQPVHALADAVRETVWVDIGLDGDRDGVRDRVAADIVRPQTTARVPVIMDASPYYSCCGRGNESELKTYDANGRPVGFPLFYDNYFVPRGYSVVLVDLAGGKPVQATWSTGAVGMIGKSYDGTVANGVAATGVEGLRTIVPIGAISSWYDYYRGDGVPFRRSGPSGLASRVEGGGRADCGHAKTALDQGTKANGDFTPMWAERNHVPDASKVKASVFVVHGLGDVNVIDTEPMADVERAPDTWATDEVWPPATKLTSVRPQPGTTAGLGKLAATPAAAGKTEQLTDNGRANEFSRALQPNTSLPSRVLFTTGSLSRELRLSGTG